MTERSALSAVEAAFAATDERTGGRPAERVRVIRRRGGTTRPATDHVAGEEPLEIRLAGERVAVTMRTPGSGEDAELALGFLVGEGIVRPDDVARATECRLGVEPGATVDVELRPGVEPRAGWQRNFYATSSCGICGKASVDAVRVAAEPLPEGPEVDVEVLASLPERLRAAQRVFERTGGLHAAGLFRPDGELIVAREDVGRHNAVDKAVGRAAVDGLLPLHDAILQVSGRASFELAQKALVAGVPVLAAVSAPSSLAVQLAREARMTLVGFVRGGDLNVYAGEGRISGL
jgi:FdhD protein